MEDRTLTLSKHEVVIDRDDLDDLKEKLVMALHALQEYSDNDIVISSEQYAEVGDTNHIIGGDSHYSISETLEKLKEVENE
tara:strand:+ start:3337 stop:3579 length:243 start_codon:yes stop_codon:yes gene_type:complete